MGLQRIEHSLTPTLKKFLPQSVDDAVQNGQCPADLELAHGVTRTSGGFGKVCFFNIQSFKRDVRLSAASFLGLVSFVRFMQKVLNGRHEERPKPTSVANCASDRILFQERFEKVLGQILGLVWSVTTLANEGIDRKPVGLAKPSKRFLALRGVLLASSKHNAPVSGAEGMIRAWIPQRIFPVHRGGLY